MTKRSRKKEGASLQTISEEAYAAILAMEGLRLSPAAEARRRSAAARKLTAAERRAEIIHAHSSKMNPR